MLYKLKYQRVIIIQQTLFISTWATKKLLRFCHVGIFTYISAVKIKTSKTLIWHVSSRIIIATKVKDNVWKIPYTTQDGTIKWRYLYHDDIEQSKARQETEVISFEERKKRNNVEASIFHYFHTRNNKTRYRGLIKHTVQAICRCAWINMRRLFIFDLRPALV